MRSFRIFCFPTLSLLTAFSLTFTADTQWGRNVWAADSAKTTAKAESSPKSTEPIFKSDPITKQTSGHRVEISVDLAGASQLYLVVDDGGNGYACDWADWATPRLVGPEGEMRLTDLKWKSASAGYGQVRVNQNSGGGELRIDGQEVEFGIGTHANSVIAYDIPTGYTTFHAIGGLDDGGTSQGGGDAAKVRFSVYTSPPPASATTPVDQTHEPSGAINGLDVGEGLTASLFAAEPQLLSPSNIDIDHRGRVWVCEIVNYRGHLGKRPEGDRILILEDTDGDGRVDSEKVFYQGTDINSPHGVCVIGNQVIVSAGDKVQVFTDTDGDDRADDQRVLFSGISGSQHDHGIHAFIFGPDGKLYFNFGNAGGQIKDKDGNPIVDAAGNVVDSSRRPYQEGMVFRCDLDGTHFETLAWNFRNNWLVTIDSYGTIWQSDNDDDGNRGVRINYVMEYGNYGYKDEMTGAGWQSRRTGMSDVIAQRHWHLNDPGVVPNLLNTGAGSPTGITVYEGDLLPMFRGHLIHCDAGPNVCRAYILSDSGAGYQAEIRDVLTGSQDKWFRPSDVKVAPDGSLIIADWYDPGVGGHGMGDLDRGRLFRITPEGDDSTYRIPEFDFETASGAVEALKNPADSVRAIAWQSLHKMGVDADAELVKMAASDNPIYRARALWLLGKIDGRGLKTVQDAMADSDANIRIVAIRLARQLGIEFAVFEGALMTDPSPAVRRELAISLRHRDTPDAALHWATLAQQYDGADRWYLEALGIASDGEHADAFFAAWLDAVGEDWNTPSGRDIIWRVRADEATDYLVKILQDPATPVDQLDRFVRALDFHQGDKKQAALTRLINRNGLKDRVIIETLLRLANFDITTSAAVKDAVLRYLHASTGTDQYFELIERFKPAEMAEELAAFSLAHADTTAGVRAANILFSMGQQSFLRTACENQQTDVAVAAISLIGHAGGSHSLPLLLPILTSAQTPLVCRVAAMDAIGRRIDGQKAILQLVKDSGLPDELDFAAANVLLSSNDQSIVKEAGAYLTLPATADRQPLPTVAELVSRHGNVATGKALFDKQATCINCHKVKGEGKEVGPDLSEIGGKLSREAMYVAILDPNAAISHNFEAYTVLTDDGTLVTGLLISETDEAITLRTNEGIDQTIDQKEVELFEKQTKSLMPQDLQQLMTVDQLVDLVEYTMSLKK